MREEVSDALKGLETLLARLPGPVRSGVTERLTELRLLVLDQRAPRFALVGRRGSGKSSLINAVFGREVAAVGHERATTGAAHWERFTGGVGELEILDTRGLQEGGAPVEGDSAPTAERSIVAALQHTAPDAFLFLVRASEVDAAIHADLDALVRILDKVASTHGYRPPLVAVITGCDLVEPKNTPLHQPQVADPAELDEKLARIGRLELLLEERLREHGKLGFDLVATMGVSSYQSWAQGGERRADERWQINRLLAFLLERMPAETKVGLARLSQVQALQRDVARRIVNATAAVAAGVAATPIPVADVLPLTALQLQMVVGVAQVAGRSLDRRGAMEFIATLGIQGGAAMGLREVARQLLKLVPGAGSVVNAAVASAGTKALGEAAIAWFIDGKGSGTRPALITDASA